MLYKWRVNRLPRQIPRTRRFFDGGREWHLAEGTAGAGIGEEPDRGADRRDPECARWGRGPPWPQAGRGRPQADERRRPPSRQPPYEDVLGQAPRRQGEEGRPRRLTLHALRARMTRRTPATIRTQATTILQVTRSMSRRKTAASSTANSACEFTSGETTETFPIASARHIVR